MGLEYNITSYNSYMHDVQQFLSSPVIDLLRT